MKTNFTLRLNVELLEKLQALAEEKGTSVSQFLTAHLQELVWKRRAYDRARTRALARLRVGIDLGWLRPDSKDKLHDR